MEEVKAQWSEIQIDQKPKNESSFDQDSSKIKSQIDNIRKKEFETEVLELLKTKPQDLIEKSFSSKQEYQAFLKDYPELFSTLDKDGNFSIKNIDKYIKWYLLIIEKMGPVIKSELSKKGIFKSYLDDVDAILQTNFYSKIASIKNNQDIKMVNNVIESEINYKTIPLKRWEIFDYLVNNLNITNEGNYKKEWNQIYMDSKESARLLRSKWIIKGEQINEEMTKEQLAAVVFNTLKFKKMLSPNDISLVESWQYKSKSNTEFADVSKWAKPYMDFLIDKWIILWETEKISWAKDKVRRNDLELLRLDTPPQAENIKESVLNEKENMVVVYDNIKSKLENNELQNISIEYKWKTTEGVITNIKWEASLWYDWNIIFISSDWKESKISQDWSIVWDYPKELLSLLKYSKKEADVTFRWETKHEVRNSINKSNLLGYSIIYSYKNSQKNGISSNWIAWWEKL